MEISISGHKKEDPLNQMTIDKQIRNEIPRLSKHTKIQELSIHIDRKKELGKRNLFIIKGKLMTDMGLFFADNSEWDLAKALRKTLERLEKEITKKVEKIKITKTI